MKNSRKKQLLLGIVIVLALLSSERGKIAYQYPLLALDYNSWRVQVLQGLFNTIHPPTQSTVKHLDPKIVKS